MADEARVQSSLQIDIGNLHYRSNPTSFLASVATARGPSPGSVNVPTAGVDVDLSQLTTPALFRISNLDSTNFVEYGAWDGASFLPIGELLPGDTYVGRFSRFLGNKYGAAPGWAAAGAGVRFRLKADTAPCAVLVEAFEL